MIYSILSAKTKLYNS